MKGWRRVVASSLLLWLSGCGSGEEAKEGPDERLGGVAQPEEQQAQATDTATEGMAPLDQDVSLGVSVRLNEASRLVVEGTTNLPPETRLRVVTERGASGVSWRESVEVNQEGFSAGPFGSGSGLPEGVYRVRVTMPPVSVQPASIKSRLGAQGEHLSGPWVVDTEHGLGQVVEAQWRVRIVPGGVEVSPAE